MSPRTPEENERIRGERREMILQAAMKVFLYKGYAATKISDIAAAAKISHGLLYYYFRSKEEVYAALAGRVAQGPAAMAQLADQPGTPREKIRLMLAVMLGSVQDMPEYYALAVQIMTVEGVAPAVSDMVMQGGMASAEAMAKVIAEGQSAGVFREGDPMEHFSLLYAVITGLALMHTSSFSAMRVPVSVDPDIVLRLIEV